MTIRMQMSLWNINSETGNVKYTISEIINFIIRSEFTLESFDEHPSWEKER